VPDLEAAVAFYRDVLGFEVKERRETKGVFTGMVSAVMDAGPWILVLVQGTSADSQVSQYVSHYGAGVQHVALQVKDLPEVVDRLTEAGLEFDTNVIQGTGIRQAFTHRDPASGMMYELIERQEPDGHFTDESVGELFRQLEEKNAF
jgi:4-hydroxyphenylpyruvate dioxygenase-like putative hemolysin